MAAKKGPSHTEGGVGLLPPLWGEHGFAGQEGLGVTSSDSASLWQRSEELPHHSLAASCLAPGSPLPLAPGIPSASLFHAVLLHTKVKALHLATC